MLTQRYVCNDVFYTHYIEAIDHVSELPNDEESDDFSIENGLSRHMAYVYCNQHQEVIENEDAITHKIFTDGSITLRKSLLKETQRFLKKDTEGKECFNKVKALIDWRLNELRIKNYNPDEIKELSPFFLIFPQLVKHESEWALERLDKIMELLESNGRPYYSDFIIDAMSEVDIKHSFLLAKCLNTWVKNLSRWFDERDIEALVIKINQNDNTPDTQKLLNSTISILLSRGHCKNLINLK